MKFRRGFAAAFAALQFAGAAAWPLVDARLEAAEQKAVAHIESERATPCTPGHDETFCQVCRTLSLAGHASAVVAVVAFVNPVAFTDLAESDITPTKGFLSTHSARSPPLS